MGNYKTCRLKKQNKTKQTQKIKTKPKQTNKKNYTNEIQNLAQVSSGKYRVSTFFLSQDGQTSATGLSVPPKTCKELRERHLPPCVWTPSPLAGAGAEPSTMGLSCLYL